MSEYTKSRQATQYVLLTGALRKAAQASGVESYAVPLCGGNFQGHMRSTRTGRCISCGPMRHALTLQKHAAVEKARQDKHLAFLEGVKQRQAARAASEEAAKEVRKNNHLALLESHRQRRVALSMK